MRTHTRRIMALAGLSTAALVIGAVLLATGCLPRLGTRTPPVQTAELAPQFELDDTAGATHRLSELIADGPAVVVFYRGYW